MALAAWSFRALLFDNNLHVVVPDEVYRSAQPAPAEIPRLAQRLGLRSIVNLRGAEEDWAWFHEERTAAERCGLELYSLHLRADRLPGAQQLRELTQILTDCPKPVLIHCRRGIDRAGLASALYRLLEGGSIEQARKQYRLTHGYVAPLAQSDVPGVIDLYDDWLAGNKKKSTPELLREWVQQHYVPYGYRAQIEALRLPQRIFADEKTPVRFRVTNRSAEPWHLSSDQDRGMYLGIKIHATDSASGFTTEVRSENFDRVVPPGASVVINAVLPPLTTTGIYHVSVDMVDESVLWFADMGSPILATEVIVAPARVADLQRRIE